MDLSQVAVSAQPVADIAQHHAAAAVIVKPVTDMLRGMYGGSVEVDPPAWFAPLVSCLVSIPVLGLILVANGFDLTLGKNVALLCVGALTVALVAGGVTSIHAASRPSVASAMAALPPMPTAVHCQVCGALVPIDGGAPIATVANNPLRPGMPSGTPSGVVAETSAPTPAPPASTPPWMQRRD